MINIYTIGFGVALVACNAGVTWIVRRWTRNDVPAKSAHENPDDAYASSVLSKHGPSPVAFSLRMLEQGWELVPPGSRQKLATVVDLTKRWRQVEPRGDIRLQCYEDALGIPQPNLHLEETRYRNSGGSEGGIPGGAD